MVATTIGTRSTIRPRPRPTSVSIHGMQFLKERQQPRARMTELAETHTTAPAIEGEFVFKEGYLADWGLPSEIIPFHLLWQPHARLNHLRIKVPAYVEIAQINNAKVTDIVKAEDGMAYSILDIGIHGYLSGALKCKLIPEGREHRFEIQIEFMDGAQPLFQKRLSTNIIRPTIELLHAPSEIRIPPDGHAEPLTIKLRLVGAGSARVRVDVTSKGHSQVKNELLFDEVLRRLLPRRDLEPKPSGGPVKAQVEVGSELVISAMNRILTAIEGGESVDEEFRVAMREQRKMLGDEEYRTRLARVLHSEIEQIWIASLLDLLSMNPAEGIRMQQGNTSVVVSHLFKALEFKLTYEDAFGNSYPSLNHNISVHDERTNGHDVEIPIRLEWTKQEVGQE